MLFTIRQHLRIFGRKFRLTSLRGDSQSFAYQIQIVAEVRTRSKVEGEGFSGTFQIYFLNATARPSRIGRIVV